MEKETIKVTINPDGTAREHSAPPGCTCESSEEASLCIMKCATPRTFEIEWEGCTCDLKDGFAEAFVCEKRCKYWPHKGPFTTHTAEITEEYPETRGGNIHGRVRIIS